MASTPKCKPTLVRLRYTHHIRNFLCRLWAKYAAWYGLSLLLGPEAVNCRFIVWVFAARDFGSAEFSQERSALEIGRKKLVS